MAKKSSSQQTVPPTAPAPEAQGQMSIEQALATAYAHWNAGQINQAELLCQKVLAVWPANSDALHLLGLMAHNWGNLDLAIDYLRKACQSPRTPALYFSNLAEMCRQKGLLTEGEAVGRRGVAIDPTLIGCWNNLGIILQEQGKYEEALTCLERVVAAKPDYTEAYNNLGNTYKKLGRLDRATFYYSKALELNPNYPEAHSNLSNLMKDQGDIDRAVAEARIAIELNPRLADAYINAAAAEIVRFRYDDALRWLQGVLAFAPNNVLALTAQSGALHKQDRHDESLEVARRAVMAAPDNGDAHNAVGQALQSLGKHDEALAAFEKAAGLAATQPEQAVINKGLLLMEINKQEEAQAAFAQALTINPYSVSTYYNAADLKTFKKDDPDIAKMEELLVSDRVQTYSDRTSLHFALGKAYMDSGDNARAFKHFHEGNRMKRASFHYDAEATEKWMHSIAAAFPAQTFKKPVGSDAASDRPIFVLGMPRSGTTLIEQILAAHPDVLGAGELSAMRRATMTLRGPNGAPGTYPEAIANLTREEATRIGRFYLAETDKIARSHKHVVDKMPANFLYAGLIALALPNARIIHSRRDAVDTCLSCYTKLFAAEQSFTYDLAEVGRFHNFYMELMDHWRKVLPADRFIEVDYEAVVDDLDTEARRLIAFCGLPWDDACLNFHQGNRPVRTASVNQVRQPIYKRSVGRWKKHAEHLGPLLVALGIPMPAGHE